MQLKFLGYEAHKHSAFCMKISLFITLKLLEIVCPSWLLDLGPIEFPWLQKNTRNSQIYKNRADFHHFRSFQFLISAQFSEKCGHCFSIY